MSEIGKLFDGGKSMDFISLNWSLNVLPSRGIHKNSIILQLYSYNNDKQSRYFQTIIENLKHDHDHGANSDKMKVKIRLP